MTIEILSKLRDNLNLLLPSRTVLSYSIKHVKGLLYELNLQFGKNSQSQKYFLDLSSNYVNLFLSKISNLLQQYDIQIPVDNSKRFLTFEDVNKSGQEQTPKIVEIDDDDALSICSSKTQASKSRVIPLPYKSMSKNKSKIQRKIKSFAEFLGEKEEFTCKICYQKFSRKSNMKRHETTVHSVKVKYICSKCPSTYVHPHRFADHLKTHEKDAFPCDRCNVKFQNRNALKAHIRRACDDSQLGKKKKKKKRKKRLSRSRKAEESLKSVGNQES
ncbi:hypothetical protein WR25_03476 [Diploscapter pachys]|uniref:C2H2-type domain-containing protein n=1 Tax=Diploscapter pachys TaxID=2018661 RepID=A0A2A2LAZ1_9BILA|nr:hypothetical protein WR25_03476 [Diploscapter pachys]